MIEFIKKVLDFCNVTDYAGKLSITNIALIGLVIKVLAAQQLDGPTIIALVTVFVNYMHKRSTNQDSAPTDEKQ